MLLGATAPGCKPRCTGCRVGCHLCEPGTALPSCLPTEWGPHQHEASLVFKSCFLTVVVSPAPFALMGQAGQKLQCFDQCFHGMAKILPPFLPGLRQAHASRACCLPREASGGLECGQRSQQNWIKDADDAVVYGEFSEGLTASSSYGVPRDSTVERCLRAEEAAAPENSDRWGEVGAREASKPPFTKKAPSSVS